MHDRYGRDIPIGRIGKPAEIAAAVAMLTRADLGALVGQTIQINGGSDPMPGMTHSDGDAASIVGPVDGQVVPRYAGLTTFARLPRDEDVPWLRRGHRRRAVRHRGDVPARRSVRSLPHPPIVAPAPAVQPRVGRVPVRGPAGGRRRGPRCNPFDIAAAVRQIEEQAVALIDGGRKPGHPRRRPHHRLPAAARPPSPLRPGRTGALRRPPRHLGHLLRRAADARHPVPAGAEEGLFVPGHSAHVGIRGSLYAPSDLDRRRRPRVHRRALSRNSSARTVDDVVEQLRRTIGDHPLYVSIDIDVLDPAHAPATGTPEAGD